MQTDIRILDVNIYFQDIQMRTALLFGRKMAPGARALPVTLLTARILTENRAGKRGEGWGSMLLSPNWAFPSDVIAQEVRDQAMREVARQYAQLLSSWREFAHPLVIALDTKCDLLRLADGVSAEMGLPEPMAALAALNAASPMDCALHDAFGIAAGIDSYAGYGPDHCSFDLSRWLGPSYRGRHLRDYLLPKFAPRLPVWHVVGGGDKLTRSERDANDPQDGLPVSLDEWIARDGVYCLKVKLRGTDLEWDVERTAAVAAVAEESLKERGRSEYFLSVDSNELCPHPEAVVEMLEGLRARSPQAYRALLYVEQPTERDLARRRLNMSEVARRKPVLADEAVAQVEDVDLARELGWSGIALKTCKGLSSALLTMAKARTEGLLCSVQDLTNPGLALLQSVGLAARIQALKGVEANARQYIPFASQREHVVHPGIFQVTGGEVSTESLRGPGLGLRVEEMATFEIQ